MTTDAEKWARVVIFILVGGYAVLVLILTIRFVIRSCFSSRSEESSRWEQFIAENIARRQRATEPPPKFDEAVSMKAPISVVDMEDVQLPSYEEYVRRYSSDSHTIMLPPEHNSSSRQIQSSNYSNNVLMSSSVIQPSLCVSCGEAASKTKATTHTQGNGNC